MKRPVAVIGFTYLIALLVASFLPEGSGWILAVAGLGLGIGMIFFRKSAFAAFLCAVFLTSGIAFAVYGGLRIGYVKQFERLDGETAVVQGEILEVEYSDGATELLLRVKEHSLEQAPSSFSLLVTGIEKEFYEVGDLFKTQVTLQSVSSHNSFSRTLHLRARGVFLTALLDSPVEIRETLLLQFKAR